MNDRATTDWDPRAASVLGDQRRAYDEMRERCPVAHSDFLDWSLFRHEDIVHVLDDSETYSNASTHRAVPNGMDPPEHTLYRRALEPYFAEDRMATFEQDCQRIASELVQMLRSHDEVEFVSELAEPFALKSLCAFLGWPSDTWERLLGWTHGNQQVSFSRDRAAGKALAIAFAGYVNEALQARREAGADANDDITASLMKTEVAGERLSDDDIVSILRNWTAGHGTVAAAISILMLHLVEHPDMQQQLRHDSSLLPAAIDEILRVDGPLVANRRTTTRDVEIGGRSIGAGEKLTLMWIAANRDDRALDSPDEVRFDRTSDANLLFGAGIHDCVGAPLARLEMRVVMEALLADTSHIERAGIEPPSRVVFPSNGLRELRVRLQ